MPKEFFNYDEYLRLSEASKNYLVQGAMQAAETTQEYVNKNLEIINMASDQAQSFLTPYRTAGAAGATELQNLLGLNGAEAQKLSTERVLSSPQVQQQLKMGRQNVESSAAAQGLLGTGRFLNELFQRGQETAVNEIARNQNMLLQLTGIGQNAALGASQIEMQRSQQLTGQNLFAASAKANAQMAAANANAQMAQTYAQVDLQRQLDPYMFMGLSSGGGMPQAPQLGGQQVQGSTLGLNPATGMINYGNGTFAMAPRQGYAETWGSRAYEQAFGEPSPLGGNE